MLLKDWNLVSEQRVLGMETVIVKIRYRKQANRCRGGSDGGRMPEGVVAGAFGGYRSGAGRRFL